jgi:hypothetical protein
MGEICVQRFPHINLNLALQQCWQQSHQQVFEGQPSRFSSHNGMTSFNASRAVLPLFELAP